MFPQDSWPGNGLRVAESVLQSLSSFRSSASLQPHPLNLEVRKEKVGVSENLYFVANNQPFRVYGEKV